MLSKYYENVCACVTNGMLTFCYEYVHDLHYTNQNTRLRHVLSVLNKTHVHIILCTHITYDKILFLFINLLMYKSTINI